VAGDAGDDVSGSFSSTTTELGPRFHDLHRPGGRSDVVIPFACRDAVAMVELDRADAEGTG
jgi:hypothetical protein